MQLVGRIGLVCARLAAAGFLLTAAAACAGVAATPPAVPHISAGPASTAPAGGSLDGQPAFVTAGTAVDHTSHASHAAGTSSTPTATPRTMSRPTRGSRRPPVRIRLHETMV